MSSRAERWEFTPERGMPAARRTTSAVVRTDEEAIHDRDAESEGPDTPREVWTVLTSDTRILSFISFDELRVAVQAGLVRAEDQLLSPDGPAELIGSLEGLGRPGRDSESDRTTWPYGLGGVTTEPPADSSLGRLAQRSSPPELSGLWQAPPVPAVSDSTPAVEPGIPSGTEESSTEPSRAEAPTLCPEPPRSTYNPVHHPTPLPDRRPSSRPERRAEWLWPGLFGACAGLYVANVMWPERVLPPGSAVVAHSAPSSTALLREVEAELGLGDFVRSGQLLDRALALGEQGTELAYWRAAWAVERADALWVREQVVRELLGGRRSLAPSILADRAALLVQEFAARAPRDPRLATLEWRVVRLRGDLDRARALGAPASAADDPERAFAAAGLLLLDPGAAHPQAIPLLERALSRTSSPGTARAFLVYALIRQGRLDEARRALHALERLQRPHPSAPELEAWLSRRLAGSAGVEAPLSSAPAAGSSAVPAAGSSAVPATSSSVIATSSSAPAAALPVGTEWLLLQARKAVARRDFDTARRQLYRVLAQRPAHVEALTALGDIARDEQAWGVAELHYTKALAQRPNHVAALLGAGDAAWARGDRDAALELYRRAVELDPTRADVEPWRERLAAPR